MNFLAHFYFSFDDDDLLLGQFLADDVKGKSYLQYPERVKQGILLHRFIDSTTDQHPLCLQLRALIRPQLGLLSPVAMDVFFDHILASNWSTYHNSTLENFAKDVYLKLEKRSTQLPTQAQLLLEKMKEYNWLAMYANMDDTCILLSQMSKRLSYGQLLAKAPDVLQSHFDEIKEVFEKFFPQLNDLTKAKLDTFASQVPK